MRIKNWDKFQHFKDRRPPWIKLYRKILDQRDIMMISDCSFRILIGCWLLASEREGELPDIDDIAFRLRKNKADILESLRELTPFLEQVDINLISPCHQDDAPETETETETEKISYANPRAGPRVKEIKKRHVYDEMFLRFWREVPPHRRTRKRATEKSWKKCRLSADWPGDAQIIEMWCTRKQTSAWSAEGGRWMPHPKRWLDEIQWDDDHMPESASDATRRAATTTRWTAAELQHQRNMEALRESEEGICENSKPEPITDSNLSEAG